MNLLTSALYDPGSAVTKSTASTIAMTALDTTNLRLAVVVPSHGKVLFRLKCANQGNNVPPCVLLGVLNGATIVGRVLPEYAQVSLPTANSYFALAAEFVVTGLTPGSTNFDAAYGVELAQSASAIKYGGPDDTTFGTAYGAFAFEAWDPAPCPTNFTLLSIDGNGRVDLGKALGTAVTLDANNVLNVSTKYIAGDSTAATNAKNFWAGALADSGTAQAGAASTITLRSGASATSSFYNNAVVVITSGTGAGQSREITGYVGATKVATVDANWSTNPDNTSVYVILGRIV